MNLLITGISGYLGQGIVRLLAQENPFSSIVGIDRRSPRMLGPAQFIAADCLSVDLGDLLVMNGIDVVLHLAAAPEKERSSTNQVMLERLIKAAESAGVTRLVIPSRDRVYERSDAPCAETSALGTLANTPDLDHQVREERSIEAMLARFKSTNGMRVVIPRLSTVIGASTHRRIDLVLGSRWLFVSRGMEGRRIQFLGIRDASQALINCASMPDLNGPYNIGAAEPLALEVVAGILESKLVRLPATVFRLVVKGLRVVGLLECGPTSFTRLALATPMVTEKADGLMGSSRLSSRQALACWRVERRGLSGVGSALEGFEEHR